MDVDRALAQDEDPDIGAALGKPHEAAPWIEARSQVRDEIRVAEIMAGRSVSCPCTPTEPSSKQANPIRTSPIITLCLCSDRGCNRFALQETLDPSNELRLEVGFSLSPITVNAKQLIHSAYRSAGRVANAERRAHR